MLPTLPRRFTEIAVAALVIFLTAPLCSRADAQDDEMEAFNQLWSKGNSAFTSGQIDNAVSCFSQASKMIPYEPTIRLMLGRCEAKRGNATIAMDHFSKAAELGWENSKVFDSYDELTELQTNDAWQLIADKIAANRKRPFILYTGQKVKSETKSPLIVLFHGRGELPTIQLHFWKQAADQAGWYLLALKGTRDLGGAYAWERPGAKQTWEVDSNAIQKEFESRAAEVLKQHQVSQLVLAGFSQGSVAALELLQRNVTPVPTGAVLFASAFPKNAAKLFTHEANFKPKPISMHIGTKDLWYSGNLAVRDQLKSTGSPVFYHEWTNLGHQMPPNHRQVILESVQMIIEQSVRK